MLNNAVTYLDIIKNVNDFDSAKKQIGELITSIIPLNNPGIHLLDGSVIEGNGPYSDFVNYMADLYANDTISSNVVLIGNLITNNGVISGFSSNKYAKVPFNITLNDYDWEICLKFKINDITVNSCIISAPLYEQLAFAVLSRKLVLNIGSGSSWITGDVSGVTELSENVFYYAKLCYSNNIYTVYLSTDGINWNQEITSEVETNVLNTYLNLGITRLYDNEAQLSIDLKECYINKQGQRWWNGTNSMGFCTETEWQQYVEEYGCCGKFVYNSANNTVRLPQVEGIIEGTINEFGSGVVIGAGLPNITSRFGSWDNSLNYGFGSVSGAQYSIIGKSSARVTTISDNNSNTTLSIGFDASRSSSIYGNSNTVQPQTIKVLYYIVLINGSTETIDYNINNLTTKHSACNVIMPDTSTYVDIEMGASMSTYIAPADGWYWFNIVTARSTDYFNVWILGKDSGYGITLHQTNNGYNQMGLIPVKKGETLQLHYDKAPTSYTFRFYYCVGNKDEKITS